MKKLNKVIVKERPINQPFKWHNKTLIAKVPKPDMHNECAYCTFLKYCAYHNTQLKDHSCASYKRSDKLNVYYEEISNLH